MGFGGRLMEKRTTNDFQSYVSNSDTLSNDTLDNTPVVKYNNVEQSVQIVCKFPANVSVRGQVTGKLYEWSGAGAVVKVDKSDASEILLKHIGESSCCSGSGGTGNLIFEVL